MYSEVQLLLFSARSIVTGELCADPDNNYLLSIDRSIIEVNYDTLDPTA